MRHAGIMLTLALLGAVGCNGPDSVCRDTVGAIDAMYARCDIPARVELYLDDGTPATCDNVDEVIEPEVLLCECVPWAETVRCDELLATGFPASCDFRRFRYYVYE